MDDATQGRSVNMDAHSDENRSVDASTQRQSTNNDASEPSRAVDSSQGKSVNMDDDSDESRLMKDSPLGWSVNGMASINSEACRSMNDSTQGRSVNMDAYSDKNKSMDDSTQRKSTVIVASGKPINIDDGSEKSRLIEDCKQETPVRKSVEENQVYNGSCYVNQNEDHNTLLQMQKLKFIARCGKPVTAVGLWDAGSTLCFITFQLAEKLQLRGDPVKLEIITVGGEVQQVDSQRYAIFLIDNDNSMVEMEVLGIRQISSDIEKIDISGSITQFQAREAKWLSRPLSGSIDLLIGFQYAAYHPIVIESIDHLLLMKNRFGVIVAGSYPGFQEKT